MTPSPNRKHWSHDVVQQINGVPPRVTTVIDLPRGKWAPTWAAVASMCVLALSLLILAATIVVCWGRP